LIDQIAVTGFQCFHAACDIENLRYHFIIDEQHKHPDENDASISQSWRICKRENKNAGKGRRD